MSSNFADPLFEKNTFLNYEMKIIEDELDKYYQEDDYSILDGFSLLNKKLELLKEIQKGAVDAPFLFFNYFVCFGSHRLWNWLHSDANIYISFNPENSGFKLLIDETTLIAKVSIYRNKKKYSKSVDLREIIKEQLKLGYLKSCKRIFEACEKRGIRSEKIGYLQTHLNYLLHYLDVKKLEGTPPAYTLAVQDFLITIPVLFVEALKLYLKPYGVKDFGTFDKLLRNFNQAINQNISSVNDGTITFGYAERASNGCKKEGIIKGFKVLYNATKDGMHLIDHQKISDEDFVSVFFERDIKRFKELRRGDATSLRITFNDYWNVTQYFLKQLPPLLTKWGFTNRKPLLIIEKSALFFCSHTRKDVPITNQNLYGNLLQDDQLKAKIDEIFEVAYNASIS